MMPDGVIWIAVGLAAMAAVGMLWCCLHTGKEMPEEERPMPVDKPSWRPRSTQPEGCRGCPLWDILPCYGFYAEKEQCTWTDTEEVDHGKS